MEIKSTYDAIKKADIYGFRKEFMIQSLNYLARFKQEAPYDKFENEILFIHDVLMELNAYI